MFMLIPPWRSCIRLRRTSDVIKLMGIRREQKVSRQPMFGREYNERKKCSTFSDHVILFVRVVPRHAAEQLRAGLVGIFGLNVPLCVSSICP